MIVARQEERLEEHSLNKADPFLGAGRVGASHDNFESWSISIVPL